MVIVWKWEGAIAEGRSKGKQILRKMVVFMVYHATTAKVENRLIGYISALNIQRLETDLRLVALH